MLRNNLDRLPHRIFCKRIRSLQGELDLIAAERNFLAGEMHGGGSDNGPIRIVAEYERSAFVSLQSEENAGSSTSVAAATSGRNDKFME